MFTTCVGSFTLDLARHMAWWHTVARGAYLTESNVKLATLYHVVPDLVRMNLYKHAVSRICTVHHHYLATTFNMLDNHLSKSVHLLTQCACIVCQLGILCF